VEEEPKARPMPAAAPGTKSRSLSLIQYQQRLLFEHLGVSTDSPEKLTASLPFCSEDITAGSEAELQAAVQGCRHQVDLPLTVESSDYFANILRREKSGEASRKAVTDLERFLYSNDSEIWENSWVRFPRSSLNSRAEQVFRDDLRADKDSPGAGLRRDADRFSVRVQGEEFLRVPISYLPKLALADLAGDLGGHPLLERTARRLMDHFLSDNTSPETFSFRVVPLRPRTGLGRGLARETAGRFLLTQLLVHYANDRFRLREYGQTALIYSAPHPPVRQKELSRIISDAFYRELFMSPCLSGWSKGEEKNRYMWLCHEVLSRSQLNAVNKLREAGIITNNLVVLPNVSNISLANNGTHVSLGSRRLSAALADPAAGFGAGGEKYLGDLAIKIVEHFLPLFVGTYSAAPYRLGFADFHPETVLGFLPHELDYTHLRMMWRRWKKKSDISLFGCPLTPFGPQWLDHGLGRIFSLAGDFVPDFRLIDYPVALLGTKRHPALDGTLGNQQRLKDDLADMGVFDRRMSLYLLYRQRHFAQMGFSGFEGRHFSTFAEFCPDMEQAVNLQVLVTALAFKYMAQGTITHHHIPDTPTIESERRQVFFGTAIGLPTFFVGRISRNQMLRRILHKTRSTRISRRYPRFLRVQNLEYRLALLEVLKEDGADLIEALGLGETLTDLENRLKHPEEYSCAGRLTRAILEKLNARSPLRVPAAEFNTGAERYYREDLRKKQIAEALELLRLDLPSLKARCRQGDRELGRTLAALFPDGNEDDFLRSAGADYLADRIAPDALRRLIHLALLAVHAETGAEGRGEEEETYADCASVY
jgi:hypothetical protein